MSLSLGYHPESNSQTECVYQEVEVMLRCLVSHNLATWSKYNIWAEYAHNTLLCSSTGMSPFQCVYGYQPPLFPALEDEVCVPAAQALVKQYRHTWTRARHVLLRNSAPHKSIAAQHRRSTPIYQPGQRVWLSARDLPLHV